MTDVQRGDGRLVKEVWKQGEKFPEFHIAAGYQVIREETKDGQTTCFYIRAPALKVKFKGEHYGWALFAGERIPSGSFITWYNGVKVQISDYISPEEQKGDVSRAEFFMCNYLKQKGRTHESTHFQVIDKGSLILNALPTSVSGREPITTKRYSLGQLCTTGGVQSVANDLSPEDKSAGKIMNTVKLALQTTITTMWKEKHEYMMTLWASTDIEEDEEIFHNYDPGYWRRMQDCMQSVQQKLGKWWKDIWDNAKPCTENKTFEWRSHAAPAA